MYTYYVAVQIKHKTNYCTCGKV